LRPTVNSITFAQSIVMAILAKKRLFNLDEYSKMQEAGILQEGDRVELIQGEIVFMSPINSQHAGTVLKISAFLHRILQDLALINVQNPLQLNAYSEPEPDITVLKPASHFYAERHPQPEDVFFLVEVAGSSLPYDREVKRPLYAAAGIPEIWIVNLDKRRIERYRHPENGKYQTAEILPPGESFSLSPFDLQVNVNDLIL
ncbi:MAG: Uma2 family endonuclease, partial [Haliscomenobacter sp.]|nr:Uma2 family endonuclease [Haliscomenobacter sp.]